MSEIRATTLSDTAGTGPITLTKQSAAKAWVVYTTETTTSTYDSLNLSSLVDNGAGSTNIVLSSAMDSTTYPAVLGSELGDIYRSGSYAPTSSQFRIITISGATPTDTNFNGVEVNGDLA